MPTNLSFAKIVAPHTETAWSQVYHAGNLFAVVALTTEDAAADLNSLGKAMFNELEVEFFSLDSKTLPAIRKVIEENISKLPKEVSLSACIAYSKEAILYLFVIGKGKILMKRDEKVGVLLHQTPEEKQTLVSSSGYLKHGDVLLMQTAAFTTLFPDHTVHEALELHVPNDIIQKLASSEDDLPGDAAALTLIYHGASAPALSTKPEHTEVSAEKPKPVDPAPQKKEEAVQEAPSPASPEETAEDAPSQEQDAVPEKEALPAREEHVTEGAEDIPEETLPAEEQADDPSSRFTVTKGLRFPTIPPSSRRLLFGAAALVILGVLVFSLFFTKQQEVSTETKAVYEQALQEATKKYDEAEALKSLNASLAQEDYKRAAAIIKAALPKIEKGSEEDKALRALLQKIESNLIAADGEMTETKAVDLSESPLLSLAEERGSLIVSAGEKKYYAITSRGIFDSDKAIIENEDDWQDAIGLSAYNGNLYVLDRKNGVLKFTAGSGGYGKSNYFSGTAPSMSNAVSMSIDGSVWILFQDGNIKKYTRGAAEGFTVSGLPSPLKNPKQIVTSVDSDNLYILDSGNSRVVIIDKDGAFKKAYKAEVLASAGAIDVQESEKKIYILRGKNLFMLNID